MTFHFVTALFVHFAATVELVHPFPGHLQFYSGVYYDNLIVKKNITKNDYCYQLDCNNLDNRVGSARWLGLPEFGLLGHAYISFYSDSNCEGSHESSQLPHNGGIREFHLPTVIGNVSAFMIRADSRKAKNGYGSVCDGSTQ